MVAVGSKSTSAETSSQPSSWCHLFLVLVQAAGLQQTPAVPIALAELLPQWLLFWIPSVSRFFYSKVVSTPSQRENCNHIHCWSGPGERHICAGFPLVSRVERCLFQHSAHSSYCSALNSFMELSRVLFLPHFHIQIIGECCIPWRKISSPSKCSLFFTAC